MAARKATVVSIVGARPQFIKLAVLAGPLIRRFNHVIIQSGQHYDYNLSDAFFEQLHIPEPDYNLRVGSGDHGRQTGRILERCEKTLKAVRPEMVLVYGDTNTTLAAALSAAKLAVPIGHIEAGLRSFCPAMPEEINRTLTDRISSLLFYPTAAARKNLIREGLSSGLIHSGDLTYELLAASLKKSTAHDNLPAKLGLEADEYYFVTLHRAENVDDRDRLSRFVDIMNRLDAPKLFLAHPRTMKNLKRWKLLRTLQKIDNLVVQRPQPYLQSLALLAGARMVMTDSGGIQKEAAFMGRPCLTFRAETEWVETVASGRNFLVDMSYQKVTRVLRQNPRPRRSRTFMVNGQPPSAIITEAVAKYLGAGHGR